MNGLRPRRNSHGRRLRNVRPANPGKERRPSPLDAALEVHRLHTHQPKRTATREQPRSPWALRKIHVSLQRAPQALGGGSRSSLARSASLFKPALVFLTPPERADSLDSEALNARNALRQEAAVNVCFQDDLHLAIRCT